MNSDARQTLYGGAAIGGACYAVGVAFDPLIAITGLAVMAGALAVSAMFDTLLSA